MADASVFLRVQPDGRAGTAKRTAPALLPRFFDHSAKVGGMVQPSGEVKP